MLHYNIEIADARKFFWQWDTGCKLRLIGADAGAQAHFYRDGMTEPLTVVAYALGEDIVCDIPDEILQIAQTFAVYTYIPAANGGKTHISRAFPVKGRPKPVDYIYTPSDILTVEKAVTEVIKKMWNGEIDIGTHPIIEVEELPTEGINGTLFYRTADGVYWYDGEWHKVTDENDLGQKQDALSFDGEYDAETNKVATIETVTRKVAEIVANAPEDFNTLKELSDWLASHEGSAAEMNSAIMQNTDDIAKHTTAIDEIKENSNEAVRVSRLAIENTTASLNHSYEANMTSKENKEALNRHEEEFASHIREQAVKDKEQDDALAEFKDRVETLLASDDITLDQLQEIVNYIKNNKSLIDGITTDKVNISDIVDDLITTATNKPLSANQGRILKDLIDAEIARAIKADDEVKDYVDGLFTTHTETTQINLDLSGQNIPYSNGKAYLSSETPIAREHIVGGKVYIGDDWTTPYATAITEDMIVEHTVDGMWLRISEYSYSTLYVFVAYTTNYKPNCVSTPFPKVGVYLTKWWDTDNPYIASIEVSLPAGKRIDNSLVDLKNHPDFIIPEPDLTGYVKNTDYASNSQAGILSINTNGGSQWRANGNLYFNATLEKDYNNPTNPNFARARDSHYIARYGITRASTDSALALTDEEKASVQNWLNINKTSPINTDETLPYFPVDFPTGRVMVVSFKIGSYPETLTLYRPTGTSATVMSATTQSGHYCRATSNKLFIVDSSGNPISDVTEISYRIL